MWICTDVQFNNWPTRRVGYQDVRREKEKKASGKGTRRKNRTRRRRRRRKRRRKWMTI